MSFEQPDRHMAGPIDLSLVAGKTNDETKLAHRVATMLQFQIIAEGLGDGSSLGTATEIRARYNVGRWALREAVGILELRGIARLRSGPGGGLIVTDPDFADLIDLTTLYLHAKQSGPIELISMRSAILSALVRKLLDGGEAIGTRLADMVGSSGWIGLARNAGNRVLEMAVEYVESVVAAYSTNPPPSVALQSIQLLCAAIDSHDHDTALARLETMLADDARSLTMGWQNGPKLDRQKVGPTKLAHRLALELLDEIVKDADRSGGKLGSEIEIGTRFDASAETVRQAIRIVEDLGVVAPRRGRHGGLEMRTPNATAIASLLPHLLAKKQATISECFEAARYISEEIAALAALRVQQSGDLATLPELVPASSRYDPILIDRQIQTYTDNLLLVSIERGLGFYACAIEPPEESPPTGEPAVIALSKRVLEAVRQGDGNLARLAVRDRFKAMGSRFRDTNYPPPETQAVPDFLPD